MRRHLAPTPVWLLALVVALAAGLVGVVPHPAAAQQDSLPALVRSTASDVDAYWRAQFAAAGLPYQPSKAVLMQQVTATGCGHAAPSAGAFYCDTDQTIYVGDSFLAAQIWPFGDAAVVQVIAHEWGHHVQQQLGLVQGPAGIAGATSAGEAIELQADCLSGTYMRDAVRRHRLTPTEVDQAISVLMDVGGDPASLPPGSERAHGSGPDRVRLFLQGYYVGQSFAGCGTLAPPSQPKNAPLGWSPVASSQ